jgi:tetratricopeptide (TPR) repeat protein
MKPGRNDPCPCGSHTKYKYCCGRVTPASASPAKSRIALSDNEITTLVALLNRSQFNEAEQRTRALLNGHPEAGILWKILGVTLTRQGRDALPALRKAAELMPDDAEAHRNLGVSLSDQGQWAPAVRSLCRALEIQPNDAELLVEAANATRALGQVAESIALYQQALRLAPHFAEAHNNLGNAFLQLGSWEDAIRCYQRALEVRPEDADIHCNIGNVQRQLQRLDEALVSTERALVLNPQLTVAHNNRGLILAALGRRMEAIASFRQALKIDPNYVEALDNLGRILDELSEAHEALPLFRRVVELEPGRADTHCSLGNLLLRLVRVEDAVASFRRALGLDPRNAIAHAGLGAALRMQGLAAAAEGSCRAALSLDPKCVAAVSVLGELCADRGQFSQAEALFWRVIELDPDSSFAYFSLAKNRRMTRDQTAWLEGAEGLLAKPLPVRREISLRYALGKYYDDTEQYDDAFSHYHRANELTKQHGRRYDRSGFAAQIDKIIKRFDADSIRQLQSGGQLSERPVFIVGMPRSGTTLSEQILASHPVVFGAGELDFWQRAAAVFESTAVQRRDGAVLVADMARDYLDRLAGLSGDTGRVIDKMPLNVVRMGLIHAALPRARIIHLQRHPIDTCLSIYFHDLSHMYPFASDLEDLVHYYGQYLRIAEHWRAVLPSSALLEVPYEALIADQDLWSRRMVDFIGLPWDSNCLNFHQTERSIITPSKWQVRQKITNASAGRWRNYEQHVGPLLSLLDRIPQH